MQIVGFPMRRLINITTQIDLNSLCIFQKNTGQSGGIPGLDLNVEAAWAMGYTGKGVTTAIMDDGK